MASLSVLNILRTIKDRGSVSRTDLQQSTGLSWGTITNTTRDLLNRNLIREEGSSSTKAGRKPMRLAINPAAHGIIGIELAATIARCHILSLAGETLGFEEFHFRPADSSDAVLEGVCLMIQRGLDLPIMAARSCLGIGISVDGYLDPTRTALQNSPTLPGWTDVPLRQIIHDRVGLSVRLEQAPNCLALAERWFGAAGQSDDVLCISLGDRVAMGILSGGELFRGSQQRAGEIGHITLDPNGPLCRCGDRGCLESYASLGAVRQFTGLSQTTTIEELTAAAKTEGSPARAGFARAGQFLGIAIANAIDLFNPHSIVLTGVMTQASEFFLPALAAEVVKHAGRHSHQQVVISQLGDRAAATGGCGIVLQSIFEPSQIAATELQQV